MFRIASILLLILVFRCSWNPVQNLSTLTLSVLWLVDTFLVSVYLVSRGWMSRENDDDLA